MEILPSGSEYWVATCPLANSLSIHSFGATKRPSPWDAGFTYTFPSSAPCQPGRLGGNHLGVYHLGNVTVDRIKGQGRRIVLLSDDFAVRNQTELN